MSVINRSGLRNFLLLAASRDDLARLEPHFEAVELPVQQTLIEPARPIEYAYFVETGIVSEVAQRLGGAQVEVGIHGRDGITGLPLLLGADRSSNRSFVQIAGSALRIPAADLVGAIEASPALHGLLLRYVHTFMLQVSDTAFANGSQLIEQRLARWLLMCQDRVDGSVLKLTHRFLAIMLCVRRAGVTEAIHELETRKLIRASRGEIMVLDRERLQAIAGDAYGGPEAEYRRLILPASA